MRCLLATFALVVRSVVFVDPGGPVGRVRFPAGSRRLLVLPSRALAGALDATADRARAGVSCARPPLAHSHRPLLAREGNSEPAIMID